MKVDEEVAKEKAALDEKLSAMEVCISANNLGEFALYLGEYYSALDEKLSAMEVCISANCCLNLGEFFHVSRRIRVCTSANKFFTSANSCLDQEKYAHENEALRRELEEMTSPGADEQVIRRLLLVNSAIYDH